MTAALYEDAGLLLDENGITIRRYHFPMGGPKRIAFTDIQGVKSEKLTGLSGKGRFWGASDPRYWFPLDLRRGSKPTPVILELLRARVPVS